MHCKGNSVYIFLFWELRGLSPNFHIHVSVSDFYIPRIGPHILSSRKGRPIVEIYNSLTDTRMWKLGLRPQYSFLGIFVSNFRHFVFAVCCGELCAWSGGECCPCPGCATPPASRCAGCSAYCRSAAASQCTPCPPAHPALRVRLIVRTLTVEGLYCKRPIPVWRLPK